MSIPQVSPVDEPVSQNALLDVIAVAAICGCSPRHIRRLADAGKLPRPLKLGQLVRWRAQDIHHWIDAGCPTVRSAAAKGVRSW